MPRTSFSDIVVDWQQLLSALDLNAEELTNLAAMRDAMRRIHTRAVELNNEREVARGVAGQTTRDIKDHLFRGRELASKLRRALQAHYGLRSEALRQFGIRPLRKAQRPPANPAEAALAAARAAEAAAQAAEAAAQAAREASGTEPSEPAPV